MGNGNDNNEIGILPIDQDVGEACHNGSAVRGSDRRSGFRKLTYEGNRALNFRCEGLPSPGIRDS